MDDVYTIVMHSALPKMALSALQVEATQQADGLFGVDLVKLQSFLFVWIVHGLELNIGRWHACLLHASFIHLRNEPPHCLRPCSQALFVGDCLHPSQDLGHRQKDRPNR